MSAYNKMSESVVELTAIGWLARLNCEIKSELAIVPSENASENSDFRRVFLFEQLQTKLEDLNPMSALEGLLGASRKFRQIT